MKLKLDGNVKILRSLSGSRKNPIQNTVFKVCYFDDLQNPWADKVLKIGDSDSLKKEFDNYSKYVKDGPLHAEFKVDLHDPICHNDKAIMSIDFVNSDNYQTLIDYYKENPTAVLETLLNIALKPWHEITKNKHYDLKEYMLTRLEYQKDNLFGECERLFPKFNNNHECLVQMLKRVCTNPVFLLQKEKINFKNDDDFWTIESIIHGDLNFNNIFVEDEKHLKLIDFEYTREDIIFDDLVRLECEIKFITLKHYDIKKFHKGLLDFETLLTSQLLISVDELPESAKEFEDIKKAAECIAVIRKRADEIIRQSTRVKDTAYWIELLIRTLKYVSYPSVDGISQLTDSKKKYALISALLLADNWLKECEIISQKPLSVSICSGEYKLEESSQLQSVVNEREIKISDFLEKIKQSKSDYSGALIDKIFVPPDEFGEIEEKLEIDGIVFITGTAGYGKTYTAIKLLWDWYNKGYTPKWVAGKEPKNREEVRDKLANINDILEPHQIIYFEDPFGKTEYEGRDDLKERINNILNSVKNENDVYVIITSRKDVFEEFEKSSYSVEEVHEFENELNILKPSYSYEKRKDILEKWASEKNCEWLKDNKTKTIVFELLKSEGILPTPLSIHDFIEATIKIETESEIRKRIDAYSKTVEKAFADEIKGLYNSGRVDRVLLLSFIFISEELYIDFVRQEYEKLKKVNFEDINKILKEEYRVKILNYKDPKLVFSHSSYSNALPYIIDHAGCKNIFCDVLRDLSQYNSSSAAGKVAQTIIKYFDKLPEDVRNLLFKISEEEPCAYSIVKAIAANFDKLPYDVRNLIFEISKKSWGASAVADTVAKNFSKLPEDVRNLLFILPEKSWGAKAVARAVAANFDELPEDVRNLLFEMFENDYVTQTVAKVLAKNFNKLPADVRNLLFKISEKKSCTSAVAKGIAANFNELPANAQNLLFELSDDDRGERKVAKAVITYFDNLPEDVRNKLLIKFSKNDRAAVDVGLAILKHFDKLDAEIRNELIIKLSENKRTTGYVSEIITNNYYKLPEDIRNLLYKFSEKNWPAGGVARAISCNFDKLPEDTRNELLLKLSEKDKEKRGVANCVAINFDDIPENVINLVQDLLQQVIKNLSMQNNFNDKKEALKLISSTWPKIDHDFVIEILNSLSNDNNEKIRDDVKVILNVIYFKVK